jgi:hypothetical protein
MEWPDDQEVAPGLEGPPLTAGSGGGTGAAAEGDEDVRLQRQVAGRSGELGGTAARQPNSRVGQALEVLSDARGELGAECAGAQRPESRSGVALVGG